MKSSILYILLFIGPFCISQVANDSSNIKEEKTRYTFAQLYFSAPIWVNPDGGKLDPITDETEYWFLPAGLTARIGFGVKPIDWIGFAANMGIDWKGNRRLVVAPIFGSLKICPKVNSDIRLVVEPGFGKALVFGNKNLFGIFKKISIGIEELESGGFGFYIELCQYGFNKFTDEKIGSFSVGLTYNLN